MSLFLFFTVLFGLFNVSNNYFWVLLLIVEQLILLFKLFVEKEKSSLFNNILQVLLVINSVFASSFLFLRNNYLLIILIVLSYLLSISLIVRDFVYLFKEWKKLSKKKKLLGIIPFGIMCVLIIVSFFLLRVFIYRDEELVKHRAPMTGDIVDYVSGENMTYIWENDYYRNANEIYESEYPNNTFDIYYNKNTNDSINNKVFIYVHGGGYYAGDKYAGDSNSSGNNGLINMFKLLLDNDYVVISANYALSPEYRYPTPVVQISELVDYLIKNKEKYKIDMNNVFFGGGSAGGNIIGQYINTQINDEYSKEMNINKQLDVASIKGVYFGCALFDNSRFDETGDSFVDYAFHTMGLSYFNVDSLKDNKIVDQSNVITHIKDYFPPSYVADGNLGTFNVQAHEFVDKLNELGIVNEAYILDSVDDETILHSFDTSGGKYSDINNQKLVEFFNNL